MDSPQLGSPPPRVDELDGLRGVLALWVALSHLLAWSGYWENPLPQQLAGLWNGLVGAVPAVETFIILSGFAISFLLHKQVQPYGRFMRGRVFRIYPVYLVCLAFSIATSFTVPFILQNAAWEKTIYFDWVESLSHHESQAFGSHVFWHLTLLNGLLPKEILPGASGALLLPAWSITLEWQYYLIAPFLARGVRSSLVLLALFAAAWLGLHYSHHWQNPLLAFLPAYLPLFLIGIGSYHLYEHRCRSGPTRTSYTVAIVCVLALAVLTRWHTAAVVIWVTAFGCIMVQGADPAAFVLKGVRRSLLHPWLQWLGRISFPLYLVHWPVIILSLFILLEAFPGISSSAALMLLILFVLPTILAAAALLHRFVEKPAMQLGKKLERPVSKTAQVAIGMVQSSGSAPEIR